MNRNLNESGIPESIQSVRIPLLANGHEIVVAAFIEIMVLQENLERPGKRDPK
jgi:hypothetical protein